MTAGLTTRTKAFALLLSPLLVLGLGGAGCHPDRGRPMHPESPAGSWYVVEAGESLAQIAARAGVPVDDLLEINGLPRGSEVRAGQLIYVLAAPGVVPAGQPGTGAPPSTGAATAARSLPPAGDQPTLPAASIRLGPGPAGGDGAGGGGFRWPLDASTVGSPFGRRDGRLHEGIDLPAPLGTPVHAAGDGQVIYAGDGIRGYGNLVVVEHAGDLLTVYAHNSVILVREGDRVVAGQRIALVGQTGRASGPHLHFEVRSGQIPQDPMTYLPSKVPSRLVPRPPGGVP